MTTALLNESILLAKSVIPRTVRGLVLPLADFRYSDRAHGPQASLLTGLLLGDDPGISKSVQDAFRTTGTSHVIAVSG